MRKSVDETVIDFFDLLLSERPVCAEQAVASVSKKSTSSVLGSVSGCFSASASDVVESPASKPDLAMDFAERMLAGDYPARQNPANSVATDNKLCEHRALEQAALEQLLAPVLAPKPVAGIHEADEIHPLDVVEEPHAASDMSANPACDSAIDADGPTTLAPEQKAPEQKALGPVVSPAMSLPVSSQEPVRGISTTLSMVSAEAAPPGFTSSLQQDLDDEFQVLFFNVAGLTLAVPLISLGGIVRIERINHIIGRPSWFLGVQSYRGKQLNLVDTCAWVMPEKYDEKLAESIDYQYLILLKDSNWGLACESLVNSVRIKQSEVNWRSLAGKRPWLAGVVKEQMCGVLNVGALTRLLDAGAGCQDPIN